MTHGTAAAVLHVPFTYFPDPVGGTEVYVHALARLLGERGWPSAVAAPGAAPARYAHEGVPVYRFATDTRRRLALAYGAPDEVAAEGFAALVGELRPRIVHLHAHTAAVSERLAAIARDAGARVVFTYHTPTASCARGTMMLFGRRPCDGEIRRARCTACVLALIGVPEPAAWLAGAVPRALAGPLADLPFEATPLSALRAPGLIARRGERFARLAAGADHVVAVCRWVREVLERNGVPADKITLSRQGIAGPADRPPPPPRPGDAPLRIAYFGRLDHTKGIDLLTGALRRRPHARVRVDVYGLVQAGAEDEARDLRRLAEDEPRLRVLPSVAPDQVTGVMGEYDLIAIPSRGLETGPLVALEAFAAGVPVLGADLGGLAELVRDGVDGILLAPDDAEAWAESVDRLAREPDTVARLRRNVRPPRRMDDVADDMAALYAGLVRRGMEA